MPLEEKLGQLAQYVPDQPEGKPALEKGLAGSVLNTGSAKQVNELQRGAGGVAAEDSAGRRA